MLVSHLGVVAARMGRPDMRLWIVPLVVAVAAACSTGRGMVSHHTDATQDLSRFHTFEWDEPVGPAEAPLDAEIRAAVEQELAARGYQKADGHWPELRVSYRLALFREVELYTDQPATQFVASFHNAGSFDVGTTERRARVYETGTLSLRVDIPTEAGSAWWALQSTRARTRFSPQVPDTVAAMFETFPATSQPDPPTRTTEGDRPEERVAAAP
jgi:hypothetical protein